MCEFYYFFQIYLRYIYSFFADNVTEEQENKYNKKNSKQNSNVSENNLGYLDPPLTELFMCPKCTKTYRLKHSLTRHIKFECGQEPKYACGYCQRRFKHKYDLTVHEKSKHFYLKKDLTYD